MVRVRVPFRVRIRVKVRVSRVGGNVTDNLQMDYPNKVSSGTCNARVVRSIPRGPVRKCMHSLM
jgi:hypothetical protein